MKYLFLLLALLLPATSFAAIATPWSATSTDKGFIAPNLINGNNPWIVISSTGTSTFANGIKLTGGCFAIGTTCITTTVPGGLNTQVQYNNAGVFGGISGATSNGTTLTLTNPTISGATLTTSSVNGVTLTTGGSATTFLNGAGAYTTPAGTVYTGTYPVVVTGTVISTAFGTTTTNTFSGLNTFNGGVTIGTLTGTLNANTGVVYATATSTPALGLGLAYSSTLGQFIGGVSGNLTIATSSLYTGTTGQFPYFSGTNTLTATSTIFLATNGDIGIGITSPLALFTVSGQGTAQAPVSGSVAQFVGVDANPLRLTFDTHNNANTSGTAFMFRRSRGTAASPSALVANDVLGSLNFRGYGATAYAAGSTALMTAKAVGTFTDTSMPTAITFDTTATTSVTALERVRIDSTGNIGVGSTSPYAKLSVHANNGETNTTLFSIGSSTQSATTTLFSVNNIGSTTLASTFGACNTTKALTTDSNGTITCGTISGVTSIGPAGQTQTGPAVLLATTSVAFNGLTVADTITATGNTITWTPTWSGFLTIPGGGTGTTTAGVTGGVEFNNGSILTNNAGFYYNGTGNVGIGSTTPWAQLSIASSTYNYKNPLLTVATSSDVFGQLFGVFATSSTLTGTNSGTDSGARVAIGVLSTFSGLFGLLDQFTINGRVNTLSWFEDTCGSASFTGGTINSDTGNVCGPFLFHEMNNGGLDATVGSFLHLKQALETANNGASIVRSPQNTVSYYPFSTSTPVLESVVRIDAIATGTEYYVGFSNNMEAINHASPTEGCFLAATSTRANWAAECITGSIATIVDSGVASSTVIAGVGNFQRLRVEVTDKVANFYIQNIGSSMQKVASISTNIPQGGITNKVNAGVEVGSVVAGTLTGTRRFIDVSTIKIWYRDPMFP